MAIEKTLLIGNGLNRTVTQDNISWKNVLENLSKQSELHIKNIENKPFPLVFEEMLIKLEKTGYTKHNLQVFVSNLVERTRNKALDILFYSSTRNVLTTNYSINHLTRLDENYYISHKVIENTFSLFREYTSIKGKKVWYIHGNTVKPTTLLLGYRQYARYQSQIRDYLLYGLEFKGKKIPQSPLYQKIPNFNFDKNTEIFSWVDIFLRNHIHIVGLNLDFTETILWWLLTEKSYLRNRYPKDIGNVVYYHIDVTTQNFNKSDEDKLNMLSDFGVTVERIKSDSYLNGYLTIAEKFKKNSINRYKELIGNI